MGQRHQIYIKNSAGWHSYHHQWCYGSLPLRNIRNLLEFNSKIQKDNGKDYGFNSDSQYIQERFDDIIRNILSTDARRGYHHAVHNLEKEMGKKPDPRKGDNNDGITVMDFSVKDLPAYALVTWAILKVRTEIS